MPQRMRRTRECPECRGVVPGGRGAAVYLTALLTRALGNRCDGPVSKK
jgi:hypothetical protein